MRAMYVVDGKPRLDLGTVASEQHLPAVGDVVELNGRGHLVHHREWKHSWSVAEAIPGNMQTRIEIHLREWE